MMTCFLLLPLLAACAAAVPHPLPEVREPLRAAHVLDCGIHVINDNSLYVIQSENYPSSYTNSSRCAYTLTTDTSRDIRFSCGHFDLPSGSSGRCENDWLRVNLVKYCGIAGPGTIVSPRLDIDFQPSENDVVTHSGFWCSVSLVEAAVVPAGSTLSCGSSRLARGQYAITDGSGDYSNDVDCYYQLYADQTGDQLSVSCAWLYVESGSLCERDWLSLDGVKFCGSRGPSEASAIGQMLVHWHTDDKSAMAGFVCTVTVEEAPAPITAAPPPPYDSCLCGIANRASRIVGGVETEANEYPWQAGLVNRGGNRPWCGGAVINSLYVLTAAHCTFEESSSSLQVLLREHRINQADGEIRFNVAQIEIHPGYNNSWSDVSYDFSLLKLATQITFPADNTLAPVCLPYAGNDFVGSFAVVSGFGRTWAGAEQAVNALREVTVSVISNAACQSAYSDYSITASMVCAGLVGTGGKDACQGDSGGPLVSLESGRYSLIGVVSWGIGCAEADYPGVYARVTEVLPWIAENTADGEHCADPAAR